jgi:preprotein translocase subunit SecF
LIYLTIVFRRVPNAFRYGVCAIIALIHDVLVVLGVFAILGFLLNEEIDSLFITAMLTVIGFSVHDTIVVFDRTRENLMKRRFEKFEDVVNYSVVQTLARSINTSITVMLTLFALFLFGGDSIRSFVLALLIGIFSGTYSSIFNASMLLVIWENKEWLRPFRRGGSGQSPAPARTVAR